MTRSVFARTVVASSAAPWVALPIFQHSKTMAQSFVSDSALVRDPIPGLIRRIAVPVSVGFFFQTMYNVVDQKFAGMLSTDALAALGLSAPLFMIIISVGQGLSTGATALIATALGAGREDEARKLSVQAVTLGLLISVLVAALGLTTMRPLFLLQGAEQEYLPLCLAYMRTIFLGAPFFITVYMANSALQAEGDTRTQRNFLILGFLLNVALDPLLIYGPGPVPELGFEGIALATTLIQGVGACYVGYRAYAKGLLRVESWRDFLPETSTCLAILRQGVPASASMVLVGLGIFVIQYFVSIFGKEAISGYGTAMRVEQIVLLPTIGLNVATLTLVAQNHGAGKLTRAREAFQTSLKYGGVISLIGMVLILLTKDYLLRFFTDDATVVRYGSDYLTVDAFIFHAYLLLFLSVAALQGLKRPMFAIYIGLFRQMVAPYLLFTLLVHVVDLGVSGIWYGIFAVNWIATLISYLYCRRAFRAENAPS